jgi:hypothetical protein
MHVAVELAGLRSAVRGPGLAIKTHVTEQKQLDPVASTLPPSALIHLPPVLIHLPPL